MPTFKELSQDLVSRIKNDLPALGSFDPTVFVIKIDGQHEAMSLNRVYELMMTDEDAESGNIPTLNDVLSLFCELVREEAEADGIAGILFVGIGKVKVLSTRGLDPAVVEKLTAGTINPDKLGIVGAVGTVTEAALSVHGMSINKADEVVMQIYPCKTDATGEIIAVDAEPKDLDSMCNTTPDDNGTFRFGMD